jgi:hypothetical protein
MTQIIYDSIPNFYNDPDHIRSDALNAKYERIPGGPYLGRDTLDTMIITPELQEKVASYFPFPVKIVKARYRYAVDGDTLLSYIHCDQEEKPHWHILISLNAHEENREDSLCLWEHIKYGKYSTEKQIKNPRIMHDLMRDTQNMSKWKLWHTESYEYNKAVIIDYSYFHSSSVKTGFGSSINDSRLMHIIEVARII